MSLSTNNSGMELPPVVENAPSSPIEENSQQLESGVSPIEQVPLPSSGGTQAIQPLTMPLTPIQPPAQLPVDGNSSSIPGMKLIQDKDLIEKEWVNKAKAIVESTKENPYKQSESLTMLKVDYMKKEFNKTLKLK
jgi:hypothetical protein